MATHDPRSTNSIASAESSEGQRAVVRLGWMMGGSVTMLIAWFTILSTPAWTFGIRDAVFWFGAVSALTLRYVDVTRCRGLTSGGQPATMDDFRRYVVGLIVVATLGWTLAQAVHI